MSALKIVFSGSVNLPEEIKKLGIRDQLVVLDGRSIGRRRLSEIQELASRDRGQFDTFLEHYSNAFRFTVRGAVSISDLRRLSTIDTVSAVESELSSSSAFGTAVLGYAYPSDPKKPWQGNRIVHNILELI